MIGFNKLASPGELGNQMFKYAALKGIASNRGLDYCIPPSLNYYIDFFDLDKFYNFKIIKKFFSNHFLFHCFEMNTLHKKNIKFLKTEDTTYEKGFNFDKSLFHTCKDNVNINGFFQTEKYFRDIREDLMKDFTFKYKYRKKSKDIFNSLNNPISIHIRRTDYLTNPNHHVLDLSYYEKAISSFSKDSEFIVFSDDINWVKSQTLFKNKRFKFAETYTKNIDYLDLSLMSNCEEHIIANSSFSWWGAWLSSNKKTFAPKHWFKNSENSDLNIEDIVPKEWILIEN